MSNSVSLTVPLEQKALRHAIKMLQGMESDLHSTPMLPAFCAGEASVASMQTVNDMESCCFGLPESAAYPEHSDQIDPSQAFGGNCQSMQDAIDSENAIGDGSEGVFSPPPPSATTVELDSEGMPWDARIHTVARTKIANGTWKLARNTPTELVTSVKVEYLGNVTSPTTNNATTAGPKVAHISSDMPPPPPPPPPAGTVSGDLVRQFMSDIAKSGKMPSEINTALQRHGVQTLQLIRNHADKIPAIRLELGL